MEVQTVYVVFVFCVLPALNNCSVCPEQPLCDCRENTGMFDVYCTNLSTIGPVIKLLHGRFRNSTINKLMFMKNCSLTTLPNRFLENVTVLVLLTSCPFSDIPEEAFDGVIRLSKLDLQNTTFSTLPRGLSRLENIKTLNLKYNSIKALNHELWNMSSLSFLSSYNGGLEELSEDVFIKTPDIQYIDLSYNRLTFLHPDTLKPLVFLQRIVLRGNKLNNVIGLFQYSNPEVIDLYDNKLTSLDNVFRRNMWRMKSLNVGKNPVGYINSSTVKSMFLNLETLAMTAMNFTDIDPDLFHSFPKLKQVLLNRNKLTSIPPKLFHNLKSLESIDLTSNSITSIEGIVHNNNKLRKLLLARNKISNLENSFQNLPRLEQLYLSRNVIPRINNNDFNGLVSLTRLILSYCKIQSIESKSFSALKNLIILDLTANSFIDHLNKSVQNLFSLQTLSLKSMNLKQVDHDEFLGLTKLSDMNMVDNKITMLNGAFRDARSLKNLNIAKNKLVTLSRDTFPDKITLKELWLASGNKLRCDCRLTWMVNWLFQVNYTVLKDNPLCNLPLRLRGKPIKALTVKDISVWPEDCPDDCRCECIDQGWEFYVKVDCSYRNLTRLPDILPQETGDLDMSGNDMESLNNLNYSLIYLNLARNKIASLQSDILKYVEELRLSGNFLRRLPWPVHQNDTLKLLTLADNPWICDCNTTDFKKWLLSKGDVVVDVNQTKCGNTGPHPKLYGRVITSLKDTDLCPSVLSLYVSLAIGLLCSLLLATSMVLAYNRYHLYLKVWLYAHGYTWVKEDDLDTDKLFDALVSNHKDYDDFVLYEFAPKLELEEPKFSLCIPRRDFICGAFEAAAQMQAVADVKRIIVILNQEYINDAFCMSIFQQAFEQSLEDKVQRVILVKLGDITKSDDMNSELKATLGSTNCITYGQKMFWERLLYAMPKKTVATGRFSKEEISDDVEPLPENSD